MPNARGSSGFAIARLVAAALGTYMVAGTARAGADLAVTWSKSLAGPTPADLQKAASSPWDYAYDTQNYKTKETRKVHSCAEAKELPKGFEPGTDQDLNALKTDTLRCRVMELLLTAKPAETSYVRSLALDDAALGLLPASMAPTPAAEEAKKLELAAARGTTWRKQDPKLHVVKKKPEEVTIESASTRAVLTVLGRGDLNGDKLDDLVIERAGGGRKGTWSSTEAFVLTRRSATGPLEIVSRLR